MLLFFTENLKKKVYFLKSEWGVKKRGVAGNPGGKRQPIHLHT